MHKFLTMPVTTILVTASFTCFAADIAKCKEMQDKDLRLACYDEFHQFETQANEIPETKVSSTKTETTDTPIEITETTESSIFDETVPYERVKRSDFSILPHLPTFMIPLSYDESRAIPSEPIDDENVPDLDKLEVKYQISFRLNLWDEILGEDTSLLGAYTQRSFWQMYNSDLSSPFRETNYEPEIFLRKESDLNFLGIKLVDSIIGFSHQSNGRSGLRSRSWNRIYTHFVFQQNDFLLTLRTWKRIEEKLEDDDNPDIEDYLGNYEIGMLYQWKENEITLLLRNLYRDEYQETYQLAWIFPLNDDINFYVEYFHGYGESLIDYNVMRKSLGIGITINDWVE